MKQHPAVRLVLDAAESINRWAPASGKDESADQSHHTTSLSLARALAIGNLSGLRESYSALNIWDPTVGSGLAASLLADALEAVGTRVTFRGQDVSDQAILRANEKLAGVSDVKIAQTDSLINDQFSEFEADLALVDPPWGLEWKYAQQEIFDQQTGGNYKFGLPPRSDSTWLFVSRALEKLRPPEQGGGRVAALVHRGSLSRSDSSGIRQRIWGRAFWSL